MMKQVMIPAVLTAMILAVAGCNTSMMTMEPPAPEQTASSGAKVVQNLKARNWGLFLFDSIPLFSGNPWRPNRRDYYFFENRVDEKYMDIMMRDRAKQLKADGVADMKIQERSTGFFSLWIIWRRSITATAVAVEKK